MSNSDAAWTWGNSTIIVGVTKLSQLEIDASADWQAHQIKGLANPTAAQDADTLAARNAALADYLAKSGGTMSGAIAMGSNKITGLGSPTDYLDAVNIAYLNGQLAFVLPLAGGTMSGAIAMGANKITGLGDPTAAQDAATRAYVLAHAGGGAFTQTHVYTPSVDRQLDTVYHNTGSKALLVTVCFDCKRLAAGDACAINALSDSSSQPTTWLGQVGDTISGTETLPGNEYHAYELSFIVLPGDYYEVTLDVVGTSGYNLLTWVEYE